MKLPEFKAGDGPVLMLNLLTYKDREHYFNHYIPAFNQVIAQLGIKGVKVILVSKVVGNIVVPENELWDEIALVEYPDANAFKIILESDAYHTIAEPHRLAALADLKLLMTQRIEL